MSAFTCVLDASALLAVANGEAGATMIIPFLERAAISAVNWSETVQKAVARGVPIAGLRQDVEGLGITIVPFGSEDAEEAALLWPLTMSAGLSFGDRACLALARREAVPALTTDRSWSSVSVGADIRLIR